jgi:hypothetical protein
VRRAGADFHVDRLEQRATLLVPVGLQRQDDLLKREHEVPFRREVRRTSEPLTEPDV